MITSRRVRVQHARVVEGGEHPGSRGHADDPSRELEHGFGRVDAVHAQRAVVGDHDRVATRGDEWSRRRSDRVERCELALGCHGKIARRDRRERGQTLGREAYELMFAIEVQHEIAIACTRRERGALSDELLRQRGHGVRDRVVDRASALGPAIAVVVQREDQRVVWAGHEVGHRVTREQEVSVPPASSTRFEPWWIANTRSPRDMKCVQSRASTRRSAES